MKTLSEFKSMPYFIFVITLIGFLAINTSAAAPDKPSPVDPSASLEPVTAQLLAQPVIPLSLPDYELVTLDVKKKVVFHLGDQTVIGEIPIFAYIPIQKSGRLQAMDRLVEARALLLRTASSKNTPSAKEMAAVRELIEQALLQLQQHSPYETESKQSSQSH